MADAKITSLTANTSPVTTDILPMVDDPAGTPSTQKITLSDLLKVINGLTEDTAPDNAADFLLSYDTSASAAKKIRLNNALGGRPSFNGTMINGKITPTVVTNDLVLTLQTAAGSTPSSTDPVLININGTWRAVTAATSCTLADGTNWFNAGSAELATNEIDYFAYALYDSNSSVVAISYARVPYGKLVSDFSSTTTNEKYLANYANFTSTDNVVNIGRFAATLSAGAGYTWTVPTFTGANLVNMPIDETRDLSFTQVWTNLTVGSATKYAKYNIKGRYVLARIGIVLSSTTVGSAPNIALPIAPSTLGTTFEHFGDVVIRDTGTTVYNGTAYLISGLLYPQALASSGSYTSPTNLSSTIPMTWANTDEMEITCRYIC